MPYDIDAQLYHKNSSTFIVTNILLILGFSKPLFGWQPAAGRLLLLVAGCSHFTVDSANQRLPWHPAQQGVS